MSRAVKQPVGQKRLTNVAVVRLKKAGHRFEVACYKNKVTDWRSGIEKDLDEVLQTLTVFLNVSKGVLAKEKELKEAFGTTDQTTICLEILSKGELQVADKERKVEYDNTFKDVATILAEKTVNVETRRPYTVTMLERALKDVHFNIDPKRSAKQQALEALELLKTRIPIERARMCLRLTVPLENKQELHDELTSRQAATVDIQDTATTSTITVQIDPGAYRDLHTFMVSSTGGKGRIDVVSFAVTAEGAPADSLVQLRPTAPVATAATSSPTITSSSKADQHSKSESSAVPAAAQQSGGESSGQGGGDALAVYERGDISGIPDELLGARKEMFAELDRLQPGWQVELRRKGETVEAIFYSPAGQKMGSFANARRAALAAFKSAS